MSNTTTTYRLKYISKKNKTYFKDFPRTDLIEKFIHKNKCKKVYIKTIITHSIMPIFSKSILIQTK